MVLRCLCRFVCSPASRLRARARELGIHLLILVTLLLPDCVPCYVAAECSRHKFVMVLRRSLVRVDRHRVVRDDSFHTSGLLLRLQLYM